MNHKTKWVIGAFLLVISLPMMWRAVDAWHYATSDGITQSQIGTERILARYERSGDAAELRQWITNGPTEAPGTQRNLTLAAWGQRHPDEFTIVAEGLNAKQRANFIESFCGSLEGSGATEFRAAFRGSQSKAIAQIIECLTIN